MSEELKHTPGPWSIRQFDRYDKRIIIPEPGAMVDNDDVDWDEAAANAHLIAAAPDLLGALKGLVEINERHNESVSRVIGAPLGWKDSYLDVSRTAIDKAEGRAE
jgi:hypothetical protein